MLFLLLCLSHFWSLVADLAKKSHEAKVEEPSRKETAKSFWRSPPRAALKGEGGRRVAEHESVFICQFDRIEGSFSGGALAMVAFSFVVQLIVWLNEATSKQASSTAARHPPDRSIRAAFTVYGYTWILWSGAALKHISKDTIDGFS